MIPTVRMDWQRKNNGISQSKSTDYYHVQYLNDDQVYVKTKLAHVNPIVFCAYIVYTCLDGTKENVFQSFWHKSDN